MGSETVNDEKVVSVVTTEKPVFPASMLGTYMPVGEVLKYSFPTPLQVQIFSTSGVDSKGEVQGVIVSGDYARVSNGAYFRLDVKTQMAKVCILSSRFVLSYQD